jgi:hypothetical protein
MSTYTFKDIGEKGSPIAMAMLLDCLKEGEPFVTYGAIREELQYQLGIDIIFPTHIGHVAGTLMHKILKVDKSAPLINALITRPNGVPGIGVADFFAERYKNQAYSKSKWEKIPPKKRQQLVDQEREKILRYDWEKINDKIFGNKAKKLLRKPEGTEKDGKPNNGKNYGGEAESKEHKKLKEWVAANPQEIGLRKSFGNGVTESCLLSGDTVDVLFSEGTDFVTVEVKSCRSNDDDFRRGIYQCVKYRAVKEAEHRPNQVSVKAVLVIERELNTELKLRAHMLNVKVICVSVNKTSS